MLGLTFPARPRHLFLVVEEETTYQKEREKNVSRRDRKLSVIAGYTQKKKKKKISKRKKSDLLLLDMTYKLRLITQHRRCCQFSLPLEC